MKNLFMKIAFIWILVWLASFFAFGQQQTPNLGLVIQTPPPMANNWSAIVNYDFQRIDSLVGPYAPNYRGNWSGSLTYSKGQFVTYPTSTGTVYMSLIDSNLNHNPSSTPLDWYAMANGSATGTVTSFAAPSAGWPSWLVPTVTNPTTTPSLGVVASSIPFSALANLSANQLLGSLAGGAPGGLSVPDCHTSGVSALIWTAATGFGCNSISSGTTVNINGSPVSNPNLNGSSPSPDASFVAAAFKVSGSNAIVQVPYGTNSAKGALACDGTTTTCSGGVVSSIGSGSAGSNFWLFQAGSNGAACDEKTVATGAINSSSTTLTSGSSVFSSGDAGKLILVKGAGAAGADLKTTIASFTSATQVTLTAAAATTVSGANVYWGTDDSSALNSLLTTVYNAQGGEIQVYGQCIVNAQITLPNDSASPTPNQPGIRIHSSVSSANGNWQTGTKIVPQTTGTLDVWFSATNGKILTLGSGVLEIDHLSLFDHADDCTQFLYDTNTSLYVHHNVFSGAKSGTSACNDVATLGGTLSTSGGTVNNMFQGYGTYFDHNFLDRVRRFVHTQEAGNAVSITDNTVSLTCGSTNATGLFEFGFSGVLQSQANRTGGNIIEVGNYPYTYFVRDDNNSTFGDSFWDATATTLFLYHFLSGADNNVAYIMPDPSIPESKISDNQQPSGSNAVMDTSWQTGMGLAAIQNRLCTYSGGGSGTAQSCVTGLSFTTGIGSLFLLRTTLGSSGTSFSLTVNGTTRSVAKYSGGAKTTTLGAGDIVVGLNPMWDDGTNFVLYSPGTGGSGSGTTTNALTFSNGGSGDASGSTFNGSASKTISYNSIGAAPTASPSFTGTVDASGASQLKLPVVAGYSSAANGECGYDSTNLNWHCFVNGVDLIMAPISSTFVSGHCGQPTLHTNTWIFDDAGGACGVSGGGSAFSAITSGTNVNALVIGSGGTLDVSGTGSINATKVNGAIVPTSASYVGTNSSKQLVSVSGPGSVNITGSSQITASGCTQSTSIGGICTVSGGLTGTITLSVIPGTYNNLKLYVTTKDTSSATGLQFQLNADTGSNYSQQITQTVNATVTANFNATQAFGKIASIPSSTGLVGNSILTIPNYANTTFPKEAIGIGADVESNSSGTSNISTVTHSTWNNTAAITSITIFLGGGNFTSGSIISLYGEQ